MTSTHSPTGSTAWSLDATQLLAPPDGQPELDRLAEQLAAYEDAADELAEIERQVQGELGT